jgi:hypothetical protein
MPPKAKRILSKKSFFSTAGDAALSFLNVRHSTKTAHILPAVLFGILAAELTSFGSRFLEYTVVLLA